MRKFVAPLLVGLGAFLLIVGILALAWVPGAVKKTPLDVNTVTRLSGEAAKYDPATGTLDPKPVYAMNVTRTDSKVSTGDTVIWAQWSCAAFGTGGDCVDPRDPNKVLVPTDDLVTASTSIFGTDRVSAEGVDVADLPKAARDNDAVTTEGIVNKFPFDTQKKDYTYWEDTVGREVPATFERTERIDGLETYVFEVKVAKESIDVAENTPGTYSSTKTIFVDPVTGSIINQTEDQQRWLEDGTQVLDLQIGFTDKQIASNASDAKSNGSLLTLLTKVVPLAGLIGGVVLIVVGLLVGRGRRTSKAEKTAKRDLVGV